MTYLPHISKARAAAAVNVVDIIEDLMRADYGRTRAERIDRLTDALGAAQDIVQEIERALEIERAAELAVAR